MSTYGLIVEGVYDKEILEEFILRCSNDETARSDMGIETRICGGGSKVFKQFPGFLKEFHFSYPEIRYFWDWAGLMAFMAEGSKL